MDKFWVEKVDGVEYKQVLEKEGEIYDGTLVECLGCKQEIYLFWYGGLLGGLLWGWVFLLRL